jgi:translation initiation factor IF-1
MPREDHIEMEGTVEEACGGGKYRVKVDMTKTTVVAQLNGRMKRFHIRVIPGDRVKVAVSPYDTSHGLIVFRSK